MNEVKKIMSQVLKPNGNSPVFNCMLAFASGDRGINFSAAIGQTGNTGRAVTIHDRFRTGSITKLFTATVMHQLCEEGLLKPDDIYIDLLDSETAKKLSALHVFESVDYSREISILHLLQHRSGIRDYFSGDERFLKFVINHPRQSWNWEFVMEKYFEWELNKSPAFIPGNGFHYSDANHLLLGVLIEQVTGSPLQHVYRERILYPLAMHDTFLEFYELPAHEKPVVYPYYGIESLQNAHTSSDWGGGGLISTMNDLQKFIHGLFKQKLFKNIETLNLMIDVDGQNPEPGSAQTHVHRSPELEQRIFAGYRFLGHTSSYGAMLFYEPSTESSMVLTLNQATALAKAEWLMRKIVLEFL